MTFYVNGIKQENELSIPVEFLIDTESNLLARNLLEKHNILILSLKESMETDQHFGDVHAKVTRGQDSVTLISKLPSLEEVSLLLARLGFEILDINSFSAPRSLSDIQQIVQIAYQTVKEEQDTKARMVQEEQTQEAKIYTDPKLNDAKEVIEWIFVMVPPLMDNVREAVSPATIKKVKDMIEELKKLKMGNNYEKIKDNIEKIFSLLQEMEDTHYTSLQSSAQPLFRNTIIRDIDIQRELSILAYVQQLKKMGANIPIKNQDYAVFGIFAALRKFFQKDFLSTIGNPWLLLANIYLLVELCVIVMLTLSGAYILTSSQGIESFSQGFFLGMVKFGILGMVLWLGAFLVKKNPVLMLVTYGLTILLYRWLLTTVITNFAL